MTTDKVQLRRQRVLELLSEGLSARQIAIELQANRHTILFDIKFLLAREGADNQKQLISMAHDRGKLSGLLE